MNDFERFPHRDPDLSRDEQIERREEARIKALDATWGSADSDARKPVARSQEAEPGEEPRQEIG
jgi:hypothetical protein